MFYITILEFLWAIVGPNVIKRIIMNPDSAFRRCGFQLFLALFKDCFWSHILFRGMLADLLAIFGFLGVPADQVQNVSNVVVMVTHSLYITWAGYEYLVVISRLFKCLFIDAWREVNTKEPNEITMPFFECMAYQRVQDRRRAYGKFCFICGKPFDSRDQRKLFDCGHMFHSSCVKANSSGTKQCPRKCALSRKDGLQWDYQPNYRAPLFIDGIMPEHISRYSVFDDYQQDLDVFRNPHNKYSWQKPPYDPKQAEINRTNRMVQKLQHEFNMIRLENQRISMNLNKRLAEMKVQMQKYPDIKNPRISPIVSVKPKRNQIYINSKNDLLSGRPLIGMANGRPCMVHLVPRKK